jgi:fermentation-respiration switch protein FrsA (DUF1100 family)
LSTLPLYDTFHVAGSGISLMQVGNANLNPWTEAKVDTKNPDRGPLLIIEGEKDHTVPWAVANAAYKRQRRNPAVTEIVKIPNRGHSLTIDHGWRETSSSGLPKRSLRGDDVRTEGAQRLGDLGPRQRTHPSLTQGAPRGGQEPGLLASRR